MILTTIVILLPQIAKKVNDSFYNDIDPALQLVLNVVNMYQDTKNEVSMLRHSKVIGKTDRQTHRHT